MFDAAAGDYVATYGRAIDPPPDTTVGTAPVAGDSATVSFSSNESGAQFECRLDGGRSTSCDSPAHFTGLPDGSHTLAVRAIDLAGNVDATPASTSFVTAGTPVGDTTPPDTTIAGAIVTGSHARLTFSSNDAGAHFQCQLDGGAFAACTSPVDYNGLADGAHTFRARESTSRATSIRPRRRACSPRWPPDRQRARPLPGYSSPTRAGGEGPHPLAPHGYGRPHGSARDGRQVLPARLGQGNRLTVRLSCPRTEVTCRIDLRLKHGGRVLARKTVTVAVLQYKCLPANEQERARKPGAPSHVDDRGHHDGT